MVSFESDYSNGAHPQLLRRLVDSNDEVITGYGVDDYCEIARQKIREACQCPEADVDFMVGGTQTNSVVISAMLQDYEGVVAATTGHVSVHEAGAIEYTGHKVLTLPQVDGKIEAATLSNYLSSFFSDDNRDHMVYPGMVYISHPTEYGTLYSKSELKALSAICREYRIPLFMDGARLGYGLMSKQTDVTLPDVATYCDVFYIGGTKVGALCGEAVVFTKQNRPNYFFTLIKQHGALLAKSRLLGIQFDALFTDNLYFDISRHAIEMAEALKEVLRAKGCRFYLESPTNQQFIILPNEVYEVLKKQVVVGFWEKVDEQHTVVRLVTSWSTTPDDIAELARLLG
ncbi:MAG: threonine aldolase family protein [Phocaeicola sp.]